VHYELLIVHTLHKFYFTVFVKYRCLHRVLAFSGKVRNKSLTENMRNLSGKRIVARISYMSSTYRNSFPAYNGFKTASHRRNDYYVLLDVHVCTSIVFTGK